MGALVHDSWGRHELSGSRWKAQTTDVSRTSKGSRGHGHRDGVAAVVAHDEHDVVIASGVVCWVVRAEHGRVSKRDAAAAFRTSGNRVLRQSGSHVVHAPASVKKSENRKEAMVS